MIGKLEKNQLFVFGSNIAGMHAGGAARQAKEMFGAEEGIGEGMTGSCYAFPTLGRELSRRSHADLELSVAKLYLCCLDNPDKEFLLTRVGCGIAGYGESYMMGMFGDPPENLILPSGWNNEKTK